MSPEAQNMAIAKAIGMGAYLHLLTEEIRGIPPSLSPALALHFTENLNAMHEAEGTLTHEHLLRWHGHLLNICGGRSMNASRATAAQRAEAFLKTIGKWEEGE